MKEKKCILETRDLAVGYMHKKHHIPVLNEVNIRLRVGRLIAMIGANGSGKSTLLRTLCGLQKELSGDIMLNGTKLFHHTSTQVARAISVVLTEKLPPGNLTVHDLVALGRQPYTNWLGTLSAEDITQVEKAIQQVGMEHLADNKHYEISDGQLQNALIARALAQDTPLIILDEPTTHLDLLHKLRLMQLLRQLADSGKSILFSTHDIEAALQFCDELVVITSEGVYQDIPESIIDRGILDKIFNDSSIKFDRGPGRFYHK